MSKQSRYRLRFPFWLDMNKPQERELADTVEILKNERLFASTIRDGIRLICDLRAGRLDVLFELFPWVKSEFLEYMRSLNGNGDSNAGDDLRQQLDRLERLIMEQHLSAPPDYPLMKSGPKPLTGTGLRPLGKPSFGDDDLSGLALKKDTSVDPEQMLVQMVRGLSQ